MRRWLAYGKKEVKSAAIMPGKAHNQKAMNGRALGTHKHYSINDSESPRFTFAKHSY